MVATPPPPVPWLASPLLPRGALTVLYAPGGDGKSLFSMALCAAIAHGGELAGIECELGASLYLDAENGEREIHRRVHTLGLPASGVQVADAGGLDLRRHMPAVDAVISEVSPDVLVLDSLRSMTPGMDENDTAQTARALDPLRRLAHESGIAILLIHHANKGGRDFRGASSIRDGVDVLWHLGRQEDDPDPLRRFLVCRKMRVASEPEQRWLRLEVDRGHVLINQAEAPEEQPRTARPVRAQLSDQILAGFGARPMTLTAVAETVGRSPKDGSVRNALAALVEDGLIVRHGNEYEKVQNTSPIGGTAPLHPPGDAPDADVELARITEKFGEVPK
ncbi:MAG TPA: AAA family ATPase [Solirubrobacteraceae bacterium]|nr:AAA family ATPase [Solirubrobacteraceae bacterium]